MRGRALYPHLFYPGWRFGPEGSGSNRGSGPNFDKARNTARCRSNFGVRDAFHLRYGMYQKRMLSPTALKSSRSLARRVQPEALANPSSTLSYLPMARIRVLLVSGMTVISSPWRIWLFDPQDQAYEHPVDAHGLERSTASGKFELRRKWVQYTALGVKHCYAEDICLGSLRGHAGEKNEKQYGTNHFRNLKPKCKTAKCIAHLSTKTENTTCRSC